MTIAEACRKSGIGVGDIIEMVSGTHWLSEAIADAMEEAPQPREGLLVEVTAIGERSILGFYLQGSPLTYSTTYAGCVWDRMSEHEAPINAAATMRKVGSKDADGEIVWTEPDLVNVYTRCKEAV